jgi:hypothetical protein
MFNPANHKTHGVLTEQQADMLENLEREMKRWNWQYDPPTWSVYDYWSAQFEDLFFDRGSLHVRIYPQGRDGIRVTLSLTPKRDNPSRYRTKMLCASPGSYYADGPHEYHGCYEEACHWLAGEHGVYPRLI